MSVFKVKLNNVQQGLMDTDHLGNQFAVSHARTVFIMGPNRIMRELKDGETFTDCNYYKRYTYPTLPLDQAFLDIVSDDGSPWSDNPDENVYPKSYDITAVDGTTYEDNVADILSDTGSYASFTNITNKSGSVDVKIRLNGMAIMDLKADSTLIFHTGDLPISKVEIDNSTGGSDVDVSIMIGVKVVAQS